MRPDRRQRRLYHRAWHSCWRSLLWTSVSAGCALVTTPAAAQTRPPSRSITGIAALAKPATATIVTVDAGGDTIAQGSGFFLDTAGVLVTNWHVLQGASRVVVSLPDGNRYERVAFLHSDSVADVALLAISGIEVTALTPHHEVPVIGERIVAIGSPLGLAATVSVGIVSATRVVDGVDVVQVSAPLGPGSSGAPILNMRGHVIAVATGYAEAARHIGFATPIRYVTQLLEQSTEERPLHTLTDVTSQLPRTSAVPLEADAAYRRGLSYAAGLGVARDEAAAAVWFREAASLGSARAQYQLGILYAVGAGVARNDSAAAAWIRRAALGGVADAQYDLGVLYATGVGVGKDLGEAVHWYRKAADEGHARAQFSLGAMYRVGRGVPRDDAHAAEWYRRAANHGLPEAQHNLAVLYGLGDGVAQDFVQAYTWFTLAADAPASVSRSTAVSVRLRAEVARQLHPGQIAEAERRVAEWHAQRRPE